MLKQYKLRNYHFQLVISILVLNIIGILIIGSAKHSVQKMQILGCIVGMVAMVIVSLMDYSFILRFTWLYYIGIIGLLGLVMTGIGDSAGGAQRWFKIGFNRAARIMDQLCEYGVVGEEEGTKPRKVLMSMEQFEQLLEEI